MKKHICEELLPEALELHISEKMEDLPCFPDAQVPMTSDCQPASRDFFWDGVG